MADFGTTTYFGGPEESLSTPQIYHNNAPPIDYSGINFGVPGVAGGGFTPQELASPDFGKISGGTGIGGLMNQLAPYPTAGAMPLPLAMVTPANRTVSPASVGGGTETFDSGKTPPTEQNLLQRALGGIEEAGQYLDKNKLLARLLGGGLTAGLGSIFGSQGQQAATNLQKDLAKLGATQRQQGQALVAAAQRGELTAPQMQQLEAFRAQQAQALAGRGLTGGTAEQQLTAQVENMRQQLLQQNLQQGLQLLQIGDAYTQQAITAGYNASQAAQNTSGRFYSAALQALGAMPTQQTATPAQGVR